MVKSQASDAFRLAMRGFASTVTIVSLCVDQKQHGMTATAITPVSMSPASLVVAVNESAALHHPFQSAPRFCVNILRDDQQALSRVFSDTAKTPERFQGLDWLLLDGEPPCLNNAQANIFCRAVDCRKFGTHTLFFGEVYRCNAGANMSPLVYFDGRYVALEKAAT